MGSEMCIRDSFLHYNFVSALLNDLYGIQARGGCQCAGPYGQTLLRKPGLRRHARVQQSARGPGRVLRRPGRSGAVGAAGLLVGLGEALPQASRLPLDRVVLPPSGQSVHPTNTDVGHADTWACLQQSYVA